MEKSNQLPKPEGYSVGGEPVDLWFPGLKRPLRSVPRDKREPPAGPASCLSDSASKVQAASGDGVHLPEPNTELPEQGEGREGLPGSKSVARVEGGARNRGGPESPCRTNCEGQAGREAQRQEAPPDTPGVGSAHSIQRPGASPDAGEGADRSTRSAQATSTVRTTEPDWQTFLRAIAEKAFTHKHHRFGDLYRRLEDKLLQMAVTQILLTIYEVDFLPCSYGYRPGVGAHDAIKTLTDELQFGGHHFVVEADIKGFFDNLRWEWLERMLEQRIQDGALLNLIRKWLRAGILEEDGQAAGDVELLWADRQLPPHDALL